MNYSNIPSPCIHGQPKRMPRNRQGCNLGQSKRMPRSRHGSILGQPKPMPRSRHGCILKQPKPTPRSQQGCILGQPKPMPRSRHGCILERPKPMPRSRVVAGEIKKQHDTDSDTISAPRAQRTSRAPILRRLLLGLAFLRLVNRSHQICQGYRDLVVNILGTDEQLSSPMTGHRQVCVKCGHSVLRVVILIWTTVILIGTVLPFFTSRNSKFHQLGRLVLGAVAIIIQLVEFGMICTFIAAGVKRSASLYRAYYRYCMLTLSIYIIAVMLGLALGYKNGYNFTEVYLTYHITDFPVVPNNALVFFFVALLDIGFEVWLIVSVKFLMKEYSSNKNYAVADNV